MASSSSSSTQQQQQQSQSTSSAAIAAAAAAGAAAAGAGGDDKGRKMRPGQWRMKHVVIEMVNELIDELDGIEAQIAQQAVEHIHANEVEGRPGPTAAFTTSMFGMS
jgi:translation initiation factor 2B subunit (eIF-2B alpha/beta/delta family)